LAGGQLGSSGDAVLWMREFCTSRTTDSGCHTRICTTNRRPRAFSETYFSVTKTQILIGARWPGLLCGSDRGGLQNSFFDSNSTTNVPTTVKPPAGDRSSTVIFVCGRALGGGRSTPIQVASRSPHFRDFATSRILHFSPPATVDSARGRRRPGLSLTSVGAAVPLGGEVGDVSQDLNDQRSYR
jgi:hypothetical protein